MFLAQRVLGFEICYSTGGNEKSFDRPMIQPVAQEEEADL